jgi:acetate---CoA ligase (ADP-forming)
VFGAMISDNYDAAVVIQDFPPPHIHNDNTLYKNDALSFAEAANSFGVPAAVCSDLPENLDRQTREMLIAKGITPLQGLDSGLDALNLACAYGMGRGSQATRTLTPFVPMSVPGEHQPRNVMSEWRAKQLLREYGVAVPEGGVCDLETAVSLAKNVGYPVVLKAVIDDLAHKTEIGGVCVNINSTDELSTAVYSMVERIRAYDSTIALEQVLVESMVQGCIAELLVGIKTDPQFGQTLVIASGGVLVEILQDAVTLLLPTDEHYVLRALKRLKIWPVLQGFRGQRSCDMSLLVRTILDISLFAAGRCESLVEMDINPLMVGVEDVAVADVMIVEVDSAVLNR